MKVEDSYICNDSIEQLIQNIDYKIPADCKRVPWLDKLDITLDDTLPRDLSENDHVELERKMLELSLNGARSALAKLKLLNVKFVRPNDYYVEMLKSDKHMEKIYGKYKEKLG